MASRFESHALTTRMREAREYVELFQRRFEDQNESLSETTTTEILLGATADLVRHVKFNQYEEGAGIGADWIWWWIDETTGEAFGAIVQAKRLKKTATAWSIDFRYKKGQQRADLLTTADLFDVVPLYALYLGTSNHRAGAFCRAGSHTDNCLLCRMSTLAAVPALLTTAGGGSERDEVGMAMRYHLSMEELVSPDAATGHFWNPDFPEASDEFKRFLVEGQSGARAIAKNVLNKVLEVRSGAFSESNSSLLTVESTAVFRELPIDRGHFGTAYMPHVLRGLRTATPDYVQKFKDSGDVPPEMVGLVGGLAVFVIPAESAHSGDTRATDDQ